MFQFQKTIKNINLAVLRGYKNFLSPFLPSLNLIFPVACKFYPTCSVYSHEAINKYGLSKGFVLSLKRILNCHPLSKGGLDLVP